MSKITDPAPGSVWLLNEPDGVTEHERILLRTSDGWWVDAEGDERLLSVESVADHGHPLAVIDPEDREAVERLVYAYWRTDGDIPTRQGVDNMQTVLREYANPPAPKPAEPTGLGAVVEDADGQRWVRTEDYAGERVYEKPWLNAGLRRNWQIVAAVRVLSEGIDPEDAR